MDTRVPESMDLRTEKGTKCPESKKSHPPNQLVIRGSHTPRDMEA